ncbi:uncharacterized protein LOC125337138 [Corvus hawaiiensis]|uniref:uncharacterized protein LOC125337138 n=1 Tax=Corvus hawaiiensis TaxID=134902 RepID=UPI002019D37D|nr:uncharacterized protein LOC125337138 [Corvus hawaiiensis]
MLQRCLKSCTKVTLVIYITSSVPQHPSWRCWVPSTGWGRSSPAASQQLAPESWSQESRRGTRAKKETGHGLSTATKGPQQGGTMPLCHLWGSGTAGHALEGHAGLFWPPPKGREVAAEASFPHGRRVGFSLARQRNPGLSPARRLLGVPGWAVWRSSCGRAARLQSGTHNAAPGPVCCLCPFRGPCRRSWKVPLAKPRLGGKEVGCSPGKEASWFPLCVCEACGGSRA